MGIESDHYQTSYWFNLTKKLPFLVGTFSLKENSPTISVGSFFSADNLTLNGPLFLQFLHSYNFLQFSLSLLSLLSSIFTSSKKLNGAKGTPLKYFRHYETFFLKFFFIKVSPIHQYFDILMSFCYF